MAECNICFETKKCFALICHKTHVFCEECLSSVAKISDICPICRADSISVERFRRPLPNKEMNEEQNSIDPSEFVEINGSIIAVVRLISVGDEIHIPPDEAFHIANEYNCIIGTNDSRMKYRPGIKNKARVKTVERRAKSFHMKRNKIRVRQ